MRCPAPARGLDSRGREAAGGDRGLALQPDGDRVEGELEVSTLVGLQSRPEAAWVDIGVDDLTKYRVVQFLYQHPGSVAEVGFLMAALGFHSLQQTVVALEELEASGVVWLERPRDGDVVCGLVDAPVVRATISRLLDLNRGPSEASSSLLERLARRSLARVRQRQRHIQAS